MGACFGRFSLGVEGSAVKRRRMGVERHLGDGRGAADSASGRAGCPTLPIGPPRLVEMDMDVNNAWKNVQPAGIDHFARRACDLRGDLDDPVISDRDDRATGRHDRAAAYEKVEPRHCGFASVSDSANRSRTSIAAATSSTFTD